MIMGPCNVILETCNVNRGPWNVIRGPCNVNMVPWNVIMERGMCIRDLECE